MSIRIFIAQALLWGSVLIASPKISIITSVYNGDEFIAGFLEDITAQTIFNECELILINAASPGNEEGIIKEYLQKFPNIVYVKLESDPGLYAVWNKAIKMARGQYITNANLDDRLAHNCYQVHSDYLDKHSLVDLVYSDKYITITPNETFEKHTGKQWFSSPEGTKENMSQCWPCSNPMWRKKVHDKYGFFNETYYCSGDWEMWLRMLEGGAHLKKISGYYLLYYSNPAGLSTGRAKACIKNKEDAAIIERYGYMWGEQGYRSTYTTARTLDIVSKQHSQVWPVALEYYLKAYSINPYRAEPLVRIAQHYNKNSDSALAFLFAHQAENIDIPYGQFQDVELDLYDYERHEIVGQSAWYVNEFDAGEKALKQIILKYPTMDHLKRNLVFYQTRKS